MNFNSTFFLLEEKRGITSNHDRSNLTYKFNIPVLIFASTKIVLTTFLKHSNERNK